MQRYIKRNLGFQLSQSLTQNPVTAVLGPRQCGKSTLVKQELKHRKDILYIDLERPSDMRKLSDPEFFLNENADKLICIDEIQLYPKLFPIIRVLVDENRRPGRFLILGSASQALIQKSTESLAGRIHYLELTPFLFSEIFQTSENQKRNFKHLWWRGGYPHAYLATKDSQAQEWIQDFIHTFLNLDLGNLGYTIPAKRMHRFWKLLSHFHGNILNSSKIAQSLDLSHNTIRSYVEILEQTYMVRLLQPYHANLKKRLIKSPKVYLRDTGILHGLQEIDTWNDLFGHPQFGASWEGWCIEQITNALPHWSAYFYRTSSGEEIDLILQRGQRKIAFEFKASSAPKLSRGFPDTLEILKPDACYVVCPITDKGYPIKENAQVCGIEECLEALKNL